MNDYCQSILKDMYDRCNNSLGGKTKSESLICKILHSNKNTIRRAVLDSTYIGNSSSNAIRTLEHDRMIRENDPGSYVLTATGIIYVEKEIYHISEDFFIEWVDSKIMLDNKPITDKNRVILLTLLALRCFSINSAVSRNDVQKEKTLKDIVNRSMTFLCSHNLIKSLDFETKQGQQKDSLSSVFNQIDKLASSSGMIFVPTGNSNYYLNVIKDGKVDKKSIKLITKKILGDNITYDLLTDLKTFCSVIFRDYGYIFNNGEESFDDILVEFEIESGIDDSIL